MSSKVSFKKLILAASVALIASSPVHALDSNIKDIKDKMSSSNGFEYISDAEYKKAMESLSKQEVLEERKARLRELQNADDDSEKSGEENVEKSLQEKLNPPKDAKEVSIEFFDLMEKEYQQHLYELRNEIDGLKDTIKELKNPDNPEVIQDYIYVTEVYSVGNNKYATMMWDFHFFENVTVGEEFIPGVTISSITKKGVEITKEDGSNHFIYKVSKRRALENAWAQKNDSSLEYLNSRSAAESPDDIDIRPPMGGGEMGGEMPFGGAPGTQLPVFPQ